MPSRRKIRVMVVDDSIVFREVLSRGIASDPDIEVVAKAVDPFDARDKILEFQPDVMTCDVEMPKMNGIEFIRRLLPQYPIPIIVVSTVSNAVFDAMNAGAVDFVTKPDVRMARSVESFISELNAKIRIAAVARVAGAPKAPDSCEPAISERIKAKAGGIIAIGASTGGTEALYSVIHALPPSVPGIVITQHIPPIFSRMFAERLNAQTRLKVKEAETGDFVENGCAYIAPGNRHMKVRRLGERFQIECFDGEKVNGHCPSVDVLFESIAREAGSHAIGIILTGMGHDGARGLLSMRRSGARTIGQDEASSVVYGMPKVAFTIGAVEMQTALGNMPQMLLALLR